MTPTACCGGECGLLVTPGAFGHWESGTGWSISTSVVRTGLRSIRYNPSASNGTVRAWGGTTQATKVWREYIYFTSLPLADVILSWCDYSGSSAGWGFKQSDSKIYAMVEIAGVNSFGSTGLAVTTGQWYRIDCKTVGDLAAGTSDVQVDGTACGQVIGAFAGSTAQFQSRGSNGVNATFDMYFDDWVASDTAADYPIGAGKVLPFLPSRDGAHTGTAGMFDHGDAGADILSTTTDAYSLVDKVPLPTTHDAVQNISHLIAGSTNYCECVFEQTIEPNAPRAVEIIYAYSAAGTGIGDHTIKLRDNGSDSTIQAFNAAGQTTPRYFTKQYAQPPSAVGEPGWNLNTSGDGAFNNLRFRFGYGTDLNPDQYLDAVMIEAEFPDSNVDYFYPVFCCGFECGVGGPHWTLGAKASFSTAIFRSGLRSLRLNPSAEITGNAFGPIPSPAIVAGSVRLYFRMDSAPASNTWLGGVKEDSVTNHGGIGYNSGDGKFYAAGSSGGIVTLGTIGVALDLGVWHYADISINASSNPWAIEVRFSDGTVDTLSLAYAAGSSLRPYVGSPNNRTYDIYIEDFVLTSNRNDYPIGPGYVKSYVPGLDGTHTGTGSNIVKGTIATPVGDNVAGATDVFNWVNGRPILGGATDNTRLVNQQTVAALEYAECKIEPSTEPVPPRALEVLVADRQASTAAGSMEIRVATPTDGGEATILNYIAAAGTTTDKYVTKQLGPNAVGGMGAQTLDKFNDIRGRFGYSTDATPDQYWRGFMIEAEFEEISPRKNVTVVNQAVNRSAVI